MVYECENCATVLPPGATACPQCGEKFDDAVPSDAEVPRKGWKTREDTTAVIMPSAASTLPPFSEPTSAPPTSFAALAATTEDTLNTVPEPEAQTPSELPPLPSNMSGIGKLQPVSDKMPDYVEIKQLSPFKPRVFDYVMLWLTGLIAFSQPGYRTMIGTFYILLILGYMLDGIMWCVRKLFTSIGANKR